MTMPNPTDVARIAARQPALEYDNRAFWIWVVWALKPDAPTPIQLVAVCSSEEAAKRYEAATDLYPGARLVSERAPLDHLFGAADLRSVVHRSARRHHLGEKQ